MRYGFLLLLLFFSTFTYGETEIEGLEQTIKNTPYSAKIKIINFKTTINEEKSAFITHVKAKVIQRLRGDLKNEIEYVYVADIHGDDFESSKEPSIMAFCLYDGNLYYAGVGTEFKASDELMSLAIDFASEVDSAQKSFSYCD